MVETSATTASSSAGHTLTESNIHTRTRPKFTTSASVHQSCLRVTTTEPQISQDLNRIDGIPTLTLKPSRSSDYLQSTNISTHKPDHHSRSPSKDANSLKNDGKMSRQKYHLLSTAGEDSVGMSTIGGKSGRSDDEDVEATINVLDMELKKYLDR
eukprot:CAMPEP_0115018478 /NCGR_PEP_ID=MMETSP0216-20121206/28827_1 /TAXON_ID=223996 /ORGANISM="Protocruzia adherens, Strain Boccale" /LENGTH=154 /DNA_ID=CAMNT_0002389675 /DNA_START=180 /DNA_END=644 /DNA_ORIENTATION=-